MGILSRGNTHYSAYIDFVHPPALISTVDVAQEVTRQPIMVPMVLEEIANVGVVSAFKKIVQKRDEIR